MLQMLLRMCATILQQTPRIEAYICLLSNEINDLPRTGFSCLINVHGQSDFSVSFLGQNTTHEPRASNGNYYVLMLQY